jgi:hypothetical protein
LYILLFFGAGCKVIQPSGHRAEQQPASSGVTKPAGVDVLRDDDVQRVVVPVDTLVGRTDSLISAMDSLDRQVAMIRDDSLDITADGMTGADSLALDSLLARPEGLPMLVDTVAPKKRGGGIEAPVEYSAKDSIVWTAGNMAFLFGDGDVKYQTIELKAENIRMDMDSSLIYASYGVDSLGNEFGTPAFSDGDQSVES